MHALANDPILQYQPQTQAQKRKRNKANKKGYPKLRAVNSQIVAEDMDILENLETLRHDLAYCHECLDQITNEALIDSYIFQIHSLNKRYAYYLGLCRERGLMADIRVG